ncbi:MAG: hypothetical protein VYC49_15120 [Pseudomonadota bacterium]|jgi:hypothetical protein|uniref:hypothetical protein n=1 Tax=Alloalcanivorax venustensis TaxID=172371 RepID=UPI002E9ADF16|nr:hypothetical protein [Pseudomonadota bacterium]|tara:strand:+ start:5687 stop:5983 length:297 start_codon:yes stop_codon:yes gene_type:complete
MNNRTLKARSGDWDYIPKWARSRGSRSPLFTTLKALCLEQANFNVDTPVLITAEDRPLSIFQGLSHLIAARVSAVLFEFRHLTAKKQWRDSDRRWRLK